MGNSNITFADIFKSNFLARAVESFSVIDVFFCLLVSFLLGLFIHFIYKRTYNGVMYSRSFNLLLVSLTMVTSLVIMAITSNVILSLGMVGALSIVRFRTAIKDPMDIVYLFWSIGVGIVSGAGMFLIALAGTLFVGLVIYVMSNLKIKDQPYLLVLTFQNLSEEEKVMAVIRENTNKYIVKSKSIRVDGVCDLTIEVNVKINDTAVLDKLSEIKTIDNAVLVNYNGDYSI